MNILYINFGFVWYGIRNVFLGNLHILVTIVICLPVAEPRSRQPLNLQPRSKPEGPEELVAPQAAIFGGARPVDTAAREKEIEERLLKERGEVSRLPPRDTKSDDNRYAVVHRSLSNFSVFMMVL
jgi:hypothetical protein